MNRRALIISISFTVSLQWLVSPVFADDASQGASSGQSADPIVQAQWSALVDAASNAQNGADNPTGNLNSSASYNSSLLVPQPANRGVDIVNESMKYHNSSSMPFNNQMNGGMLGSYNQMHNGGQNNFNAYGMQNGMNSMSSMNNSMSGGMNAMGGMNSMNGMMNNGMSNNFVMPAGGNPMQNQMMQSQMMGNGCMHQGHCCGHGNGMNSGMMNNGMNNGMMNNGSTDGLNTQAIGALGAATLMGVFMQKGGVGGILQDMGWDGSRHVRGSSIGGY